MPEIKMPFIEAPETYDRDWFAVAACATGLIASVGGLTAYSFGVFIGPLSHEFGWSRGQISGAATATQVSLVLSSVLWGLLLDRFGPRRALLSSVTGLALGLLLLSRLTGPLWHLYVALCLVPLLAAAANPLGYNGVLVRRFQSNLGLALGISLMGVGLGAALLPVMAQRIITAHGWRSAYVVLAVLALAVGLPSAWAATRHAHGPVVHNVEQAVVPVWPLVRTRAFLVICALFFCIGSVATGTLTHFVPLLTDRGLTPALATKIVSLAGISTLLSRGLMGWLLDRVPAISMIVAVALLAVCMCLLLVYSTKVPLYSLAAVLLGFIVGAEVDFIGFLVRRYFGSAAFGRLYALGFAAAALGPGAAIIGYSYDHYHGYRPGLFLFALISLAAAALAFALPPAPQLTMQAEA